jgi:hypothetical protein
MSGKRDSARNALRRAVPFLAERHHDDILNELDAENLLDVEGKRPNGGRVHAVAGDAALPKRQLMTPLQASQVKNGANRDLLRSVMASARRMGFVIDMDKQVDSVALDAALKGRDVTERLALKSALAKLALIP